MELVPDYLDLTTLTVGSFLARYREPTLTAYTQDLRAFLGWCRTYEREPLRVTRGELDMYVQHLESRGYAAATVARRFGTVATCYKYAVIDCLIPANPAAVVTRPKVVWEGQRRTVLHPLEFAALLAAARTSDPPTTPWYACSGRSACGSQKRAPQTSPTWATRRLRAAAVLGKGAKPADTPLPIPVLRAVRKAVDGRTAGPILRTPHRAADGPRRRHPGIDPGRPRRRRLPGRHEHRLSGRWPLSELNRHYARHANRTGRAAAASQSYAAR